MKIKGCLLVLVILATVVVDASKNVTNKSISEEEKIEKRRILIWLPMSTKSHYITFKVSLDNVGAWASILDWRKIIKARYLIHILH